MPCDIHKLKDGTTIIACTRGPRERHYCTCGRVARFQCDYPLSGPKEGQMCDRWICGVCKQSVGEDRDYCPVHARLAQDQPALPGIIP